MKLQYLGTAAYEGIPAFFCQCNTCTEARRRGGKDIRTRSQAILDDRLLIDFPADTYMHYINFDIKLRDIKACIITHSHSDHLYAEDLVARETPYCDLRGGEPLVVYGGRDAYDKMKAINNEPENWRPELVKPFEAFDADGYTVIPLNANHALNTSPYIYLIEKDDKVLFYSNDTGLYPEETWDFLKSYKKRINLVSFDCTKGSQKQDYPSHLSLPDCIEIREELCRMNLCDDNTKYVLTHFSHNGKDCLYDDMVKAAAKENFEVAYDGMVVEF